EAHEAALRGQVTAASELEGARASLAAAESALGERRTELTTRQGRLTTLHKEIKTLRGQRDERKESLEALRALEQQQGPAVEAQLAAKRTLERKRLKHTGSNASAAEATRNRQTMETQEEVRLATARQRLEEIESTLAQLPPADADEKPVPPDELRRTIQTL